jgi:hypothetical protein
VLHNHKLYSKTPSSDERFRYSLIAQTVFGDLLECMARRVLSR